MCQGLHHHQYSASFLAAKRANKKIERNMFLESQVSTAATGFAPSTYVYSHTSGFLLSMTRLDFKESTLDHKDLLPAEPFGETKIWALTYWMRAPHAALKKFYRVASCQPVCGPGTVWPAAGRLGSPLLDSGFAFALYTHNDKTGHAHFFSQLTTGEGRVMHLFSCSSIT